MEKQKPKRKDTKPLQKEVSNNVLFNVFHYRPTAEDKQVKKLLSFYNL